ncbi:phosphatidylinositol N-acetylglucosaminyltransferase [Malassezia yamatoensis]|uniref:Phosphatidylinositol N-acetylglucosaminyltransferase n=1 Tax=Malassezia yamatoensis TaxID=253288 RepID=A0AAJ5YUY4_9BASI|nr:phosphatidylinositol N-acetylglucosaminyltransferase [Malassezia yamatoensis]
MQVARQAAEVVRAQVASQQWKKALEGTLFLLQIPHTWDVQVGSTLSIGLDVLLYWAQSAKKTKTLVNDREIWSKLQMQLASVLYECHASTANRIRRVISILLDYTQDCDDLDQIWVQEWFTRAQSEPDSQTSLIILELLLSQRSAFVLSKLSGEDFFASIIDAMQAGRGNVSRRSRLAMAFLHACQAQSQSFQPWLEQLAQALILAEDRGMENLMVHLVQPLLDARPDLLDSLVKDVCFNYPSPELAEQSIRSLLAVLRIAKARDLMVWEDEQMDTLQTEPAADTKVYVPSTLLHKCVTSASYRLQVAALGLTVESKTPAASFHPTELAAWRTFFHSGLALPSAVARKEIIATFVKFLVKMRVSMHALKKKDPSSRLLREMQDTLQDLYRYALQSTHPQSPYASSILGVSMTFLLLESVLALSAPKSELDNFSLQDAVRALHKAKQTYPAAMSVPGIIPNTALTLRLLHLASKSTYSDIQQTAALLLLRLAPIQSTSLASPKFLREKIVKPSMMQLGATKESDAYAALQLLRLYSVYAEFDKDFVLAELEQLAQSIHTDSANKIRVPNDVSWLIHLLAAHIDLLNARIAYATTHGIAKASQQQALHGTLSAVEFLLSRVSTDIPAKFLEAIDQCVNRVWVLAAPVLCAAAPEGNSLNIEDDPDENESDHETLTESESLPDNSWKHHNKQPNHTSNTLVQPASELQAAMQLTDIPDTPTYQRILSYAWRALRSTASLHATNLCLASSKQMHSMLESGSDLFIAWMLNIRHRGAFSTIFPELDRVSHVLLDQGLENPTHWLKRLLSQLHTDCEQYSTTRRSAGIGYVVLALLRAHVRHGLRPLLSECCAQLVDMSRSLHSSIRITHAMNIMRVLVMDSTLAPFMREHLGSILARAVTCFCSPHWNVRNASMMLFSAISIRYYGGHAYADLESGQKPWKIADQSVSSSATNRTSGPSLDRLLVSSPALGSALVDVLKENSQHLRAEDLESVGHGSSLFAALLLLSTIHNPALHASILPLPQIQAQVEKCAYSANLKLRVQAAKCFPKLVCVSKYASCAERLWREASLADQNKLHGQLLLLDAMDACINLSRLDLLVKNSCAVTTALYLDIAHKSVQRDSQITTKVKPIAQWVGRLVRCVSGKGSEKFQHESSIELNAFDRLVHDPFVCWLLPVAFRFAIAFPTLVELPPITSLLLDSDNLVAEALLQCFEEISDSCLEALPETLSSLHWDASHFQACLADLALVDSASRNVRVSAANLAYALRTCANCDWVSRRGPLLITAWSVDSISVRQALLPLLGLASRESSASNGDPLQPHAISYDAYLRGCLPLWKASADERSTVSLRNSTIHAIGAAISNQTCEPWVLYKLRLLLLKLLHDDDVSVRGTACKIASQHSTQAQSDPSLSKFGTGFEFLRMGEMRCTELLYQTISAETPVEFSKRVQEYLLPGKCNFDSVDRSSSTSDTALFSMEELNQYHDPILDMLRAHRYFVQRKLPVPDKLAQVLLHQRPQPASDHQGKYGEQDFQDQVRATLVEDLACHLNGAEPSDAVANALEQLLITVPKQDESHARYRIAYADSR